MQSTGRRGFWIPPEDAFENAPPGSTAVNRPPQEPPTPTRATTTNHRPPLPLPVSARTPQRPPPRPVPQSAPAYTTSQPSSSRHNGRTGQEYNRRQRRFEGIFEAWSQEMARLEEEHRKVTQSCVTEDESKRAMDDFNRKAQSVFTRYNEEIETLQMSSSEPGSSQSEAEDDEDEVPARTPSRTRGFHNEDAEGDSDNDGPSPSEHDDDNDDDSEEDEEEDVKNKGLSSDPIIHGTGS
ncbi:9564_t:CDS:2, partial [Acaulospora colombiana]